MPMLNEIKINKEGILLIDKPAGRSSFSIVAEVRRKLGVKKVGHAGTLDPFATGLLIILVGKNFTRKAGEFLKLDKEYRAAINLSKISTTGDIEGEISEVKCLAPTIAQVKKALKQFVGEQMQTPHIYSAVKIKGQPAYKLARKGEKVSLLPKKITIYSIDLVSYKHPELIIRVKVSSGTYIRVLAEDLGKALHCGGYLTELRRTTIGDYKVKDAVAVDQIGN